jgi:Fe-S cluster biogenesis protein NfuA
MEDAMFEKVNEVLDTVRPMLMADGGNVDLVSVENGIVKLKLKGACGSCPMSQMTLKMGIERELKRQLPEVTQVVAV